jgi:23S rRNA (uridine2552-2'-O)-methyltransferase
MRATAARHTKSGAAWVQSHAADPFVGAARRDGYVCRSAYKLTHIDDKFRLFSDKTSVAVDLGAAPGGWCQVIQRRAPNARVVGVDLNAMRAPLPGVAFVRGDFSSLLVQRSLAAELKALGVAEGGVDVVTSDMCPNRGSGGERHVIAQLNENALHFAVRQLRVGGCFVCKLLGDQAVYPELMARAERHFLRAHRCKPPASRSGSDESFLVCVGRLREPRAPAAAADGRGGARYGLDDWPGLSRRGGPRRR